MTYTDARPSPSADRKISVIFWVLLAVLVASGVGLWTGWGNADHTFTAPSNKIGVFLFVVAGWLISLCLHEYAHARMALHGGDISVGTKGYLTLNPLKYTHPIYSFVMPLIFIILGGIALPGGAVFIERGRIQGKWKHSLISAAGPAVNLVLALALLIPLSQVKGIVPESHYAFYSAVGYLAMLQLMAGILNLVPMPGLDGYGIIEPWLSYDNRRAFNNLAPYGMMIVFLLLWNPTVNNWFFNDVIYRVLGWFGGSAQLANDGSGLFHFFSFHLGSVFGS
ncbi:MULTISPECIES: site-2 protease family protein [Streptacidiphilus]|uniref:Site-2 protease family protein n=1 Tax=Streptacidiphilus cavernicola TaxID=3342716 RepID=A0ABV6UFQ1_9ACTN|nr:site-2 protease family protein [Streptacidiphilus jeojiense]